MPNRKTTLPPDELRRREPPRTEPPRSEEPEPPKHVSAELQRLLDNPNLNQAGNERGSHDEPLSGSQTGADID
jgi:hypothetical protein